MSSAQIKQFMEAADSSLLNNSMFHKRDETVLEKDTSESVCNDVKELRNVSIVNTVNSKYCEHCSIDPVWYNHINITKKNVNNPVRLLHIFLRNGAHDLLYFPQSQRYIIDDTENSGVHVYLSESMQKHLANKFKEISEKYYEFYDAPKTDLRKIKNKFKNRLKLLKDSDCFVTPYEDFEYDVIGPTKKPVIKRRVVDDSPDCDVVEDALKAIAVDGDFILSGQEVNAWAKKKERRDKVFYYKMASNGVLHAKEEINEFTKLRNKNMWNENKIKNFRKT